MQKGAIGLDPTQFQAMELDREQSNPAGTAGPVGGRQMLDTGVRGWHQDVHGGRSGLCLAGLHPSAAQPEQQDCRKRLDGRAGFSLTSWKHLSVFLAGPRAPYSTVSGQSGTTEPQQLSFSSSLLGFSHPMGFASRWQATPGRAPGQLRLAAELLSPKQYQGLPPALLPFAWSAAALCPQQAQHRANPPGCVGAVRLGGLGVRAWGVVCVLQHREEVDGQEAVLSKECMEVFVSSTSRAELHSSTCWPLSPEKHFCIAV